MHVVVALADALTTHLNAHAGEFSQPVSAVRRYQPTYEGQDLLTLRVSVVPKSVTITAATRVENYFDCVVDIGVQKKIDPEQQELVDNLARVVQEIVDHLRGRRLEEFPEAAWVKIENEPIFAPDHLEQLRVFTSVISVTYRLRR